MAARIVDGPRKEWLTTDEAAAWLGVKEKVFLALVELYPWIRPSKLGKRTIRWYWLDLVCLSRILQHSPPPAEEISEENS